ncbi:MAG: sialidase [Acidobacteriota bacterium]
MTIRTIPLLALGLLCLTPGPASSSPELPDDAFDALQYRYIGPVGNRVPAVMGVAGDPKTYYAGTASGGIFKSSDGGHTWTPIFDDTPASSIGALAVAPSDPNVVWAGTGEAFIRSNISIGDGVYRSTDAGKTWENRGLRESGRISRVVVDPRDPDVAFVAALGHCYGPQKERGIFRTRDGGASWEHVLFVDENTGASDLVMDPTNPRILFAGTWQFEMSTFGRTSGGPGSGLWTSRDGGDTWTRLEGDGLPDSPWGKVALTMSKDDPRRIYALIETSSNRDFAPFEDFAGVLWRSDDGGGSWTMVNASNDLVQRPLYYSRALAAPDDADEVHFMAVLQSVSLDGGHTHRIRNSGYDHHDIWIDPEDPERQITGHDGGVSLTVNGGETWFRPQLPIAQMYHVAVDDQVPYFVYGNRQDGSTFRGPSNSRTGGEIPIGAWQSVGGCEVGFTLPTPGDPDTIWSGCYDGILDLYDHRTGHRRNVSVWPEAIESWPGEDLKYRFHWSFPVVISPHDPQRVFAGSQFVHRTVDGGQRWEVISPDLTSNDPELQKRTGGLTLDDAGPTLAPTLFAMAASPLAEGEIWTGANDGTVQLTRDGGTTWTDLTANLGGVPPRGTISNIEPSAHRSGTAYLTVDRHQLGDNATYVYRTEDFGATWTKITDGVPQDVFAYAHCVREDPAVPGLLYLGTENGVYVSFDDGGHWRPLQSNLPPAPVHWLVVQEHFGDLVVGTYGRGFWILDDLTPVRAMALGARDAEDAAGVRLEDRPVLFPVRPTYRFRPVEAPASQPNDPVAGKNPEGGAVLHVYLPEGGAEGAEITVLDAAGETVRTLDGAPSEEGLHRLRWDLRYDRTPEARLRTRPEENSKIEVPGKGWRGLSDHTRPAILAPPGIYTVRLDVGETRIERTVEVRKDPNTTGTEADIAAQFEVMQDLRDLATRSTELVNAIEWQRRQLDVLRARLDDLGDDAPSVEDVVAEADALEDRLKEIEGAFFDLRLTGARQDSLRWKRFLFGKIGQLAGHVEQADHPPTDAQLEVFEVLKERVEAQTQRYRELVEGDLPKVNGLLADRGLAGLIVAEAVRGPAADGEEDAPAGEEE